MFFEQLRGSVGTFNVKFFMLSFHMGYKRYHYIHRKHVDSILLCLVDPLLCYLSLFLSLLILVLIVFCCKQAEEKAREESERLRQQEREQMTEKRKRDLVIPFAQY